METSSIVPGIVLFLSGLGLGWWLGRVGKMWNTVRTLRRLNARERWPEVERVRRRFDMEDRR